MKFGRTNKRFQNRHAQSILEYMTLIGIVVVVITAMRLSMQRGIQRMIKIVADQIGNQQGAEQTVDESGYLINQITVTRAEQNTTERDHVGVLTYYYGDRVETDQIAFTNGGFTNSE